MRLIQIFVIAILLIGCTKHTTEVPFDKFIGVWELKGTPMIEGMQINIQKEETRLIGKIFKLNQNKYVKLFADSNDVWISNISRASNYEFKLTENKIGKELFAVYGIKSTQDFKVQFIDENTFGLATESSDPKKSGRIYRRIK